jgi:hypothetical protein
MLAKRTRRTDGQWVDEAPVAELADTGVGLEIDHFVFDRFPDPLDNNMSRQEPLPSMLIATALFSSTPVNSALVN